MDNLSLYGKSQPLALHRREWIKFVHNPPTQIYMMIATGVGLAACTRNRLKIIVFSMAKQLVHLVFISKLCRFLNKSLSWSLLPSYGGILTNDVFF